MKRLPSEKQGDETVDEDMVIELGLTDAANEATYGMHVEQEGN